MTDPLDRIRRAVAKLTPDQIADLAGKLDDDDLALLTEVMRDTFVIEAGAFDLLGYTPNPGPQTELHRVPTFTDGGPFDVLYGGAAFGGKSWGLLMDALAKAHQYPGLEVWLVRETYPQLYDSFIGVLEQRLNMGRALGATWNAGRHELRLPNTSILKFRHARNMKDAADMLSAECQYLILDERTRLDPRVVAQLTLRVRSGKPGVPVIGVRSGSNPGGPGHSTVKAEFVDPDPLGGNLQAATDENGQVVELAPGVPITRLFIRARIQDNPAGRAADPSYEHRLNLLPPDLRSAYRDGDWSRFEGMRFARFDPTLHIADPADWPLDELLGYSRGIGIDYGGTAPYAAIFGAKVGNTLVVYREIHAPGLTPIQQAQRILAAEAPGERNGKVPTAWIDPSTYARNPDQPKVPRTPGVAPAGSIADKYHQTGVPVHKAHNDRITGWSSIDELLSVDDDGQVRLVILASCPNLIRSLAGAPRDETNPEDVDPKYRDDHALDAFRYLVMGLYGAPVAHERKLRNVGARTRASQIPTGVRS